MSEVLQPNDDEIDLFELFTTLWNGKWFISGFVALAAFSGFGYTQIESSKYEVKYGVSVPYTSDLYSLSVQQIEANNNRFLALLGGTWSQTKRSFNLPPTLKPFSDTQPYIDEFERHNQTITAEILYDAEVEVALIQNELSVSLSSTERAATDFLNAKRAIRSIKNGQKAFSFSSASITKTSPKVSLTLALSIMLGGFIGVFFVLVRNAINKRKERLVEDLKTS